MKNPFGPHAMPPRGPYPMDPVDLGVIRDPLETRVRLDLILCNQVYYAILY